MKGQIIGRFESPEAIIFSIDKELKLKGITDFTLKSTPNGAVYLESDNEDALAFAYDIKCRIERLEAAE